MSAIEYRLPQERRIVTEFPGPRSAALAERRKKVVGAGVASTLPVYVADADGGVIVDVDGNSLIDLGAGIAVTSVGASNPAVVSAVQDQVAHFTHTCFMVAPYEGYVEVAERLAELTPGDHEKRSVLFNSGAEAVENAVKIARHATGRDAVVVFDHAYHGRTNLTMALTSKSMPYKSGFGPFAPEVYRVPMSYPYREGLNVDGSKITGEQAAQRAITMIEKQVGAANTAAILIEPIQGEGGFIVPAEGFLRRSSRGPRRTASSSSPTRFRQASLVPAPGSPAITRASSPTWSLSPRASQAACRSPLSRAAPSSSTPSTPAASVAPTAVTPSPAPLHWRPSTRCVSSTSVAAHAPSSRPSSAE